VDDPRTRLGRVAAQQHRPRPLVATHAPPQAWIASLRCTALVGHNVRPAWAE
jgi:hypothetical protein